MRRLYYANKLQYQQLAVQSLMKNSKQLSIEKIIRKYENRQEKLLIEINQQNEHKKGLHEIPSTKSPFIDTALDTPQFHNNQPANDKYASFSHRPLPSHTERTHKKPQHFSHHLHQQIACVSFEQNNYANMHQKVLKQLSNTQEKLEKSQRAYAEIWRKYEKLLHDKQFSGLQVQIQQKLRRNEASELQSKIQLLQKELTSLKQLLHTKQQSISSLKGKLQQKGELLMSKQSQLCELRSSLSVKQFQVKEQAVRMEGGISLSDKLGEQLQRLGSMLIEKQNEKKCLLQQLQRSYIGHRQEMEVLKLGYLKVQVEYKQWIDQVSAQKLKIIQEYEARLKESRQKSANSQYKMMLNQQHSEYSAKRQQQMNKLYNISIKQTQQLQMLRSQRQALQNLKADFIVKVSLLENSLITKSELYDHLQVTYNKLKEQYHSQQQRHREALRKYNEMNKQFLELRSKCKVMFEESEMNKGRVNQGMEITRMRKQLICCKEQLQKSKNYQLQLSHRFTQTVNTIKNKLTQLQSQKQSINTDLLAERLQNAQLKEELLQTREHLKKQYELSLQSTRRQMQKGGVLGVKGEAGVIQKENLYCQLRQLQRKYQLMNSEVVTRGDMINIANKVYKRNLHKK